MNLPLALLNSNKENHLLTRGKACIGQTSDREEKSIDSSQLVVQGILTPFVAVHQENKLKILVAMGPFLLFTSLSPF